MNFPERFIWGAATSSYQIEGATQEGGRGPSIWDAFCRRDGAVLHGDTGDAACEHYHRAADDVALMRDLSLHAYRFSIAWPRVMPGGRGTVNEAGLDFYDRLVDHLIDAGIEPYVTLYHWDLPLALHHKGGWLNRDSADWFADYTRVIVDRLSDRVRSWITINEPQICVELGYGTGTHAPGMRLSVSDRLRVAHHMLLAHGRSVREIRAHAKTPPVVGWSAVCAGAFPTSADAGAVERARELCFEMREPGFMGFSWYADPICAGHYPEDGLRAFAPDHPPEREGDREIIAEPTDFIGLNIYAGSPTDAKGPAALPPGTPRTAMGWPVTPDAMRWLPRFVSERYQQPVYITENGLANLDWLGRDGRVRDPQRIEFLDSYLGALAQGIADGADVRGYFQWSLLDNFEWALGYDRRFGLIHVDFDNQRRTLKDSAHWYKKVIESNGATLTAPRPEVQTRTAPIRPSTA